MRHVIWQYDGYCYLTWDDYEEDNIKTFHEIFVRDPSGQLVYSESFPMSPYTRQISFNLFKQWVDMGRPRREDLGGHFESDHIKYYKQWLDDQIEKALLDT